MNLLIFLDLTYNPGKNFKFYSLQGQNFNFFVFLPITRAKFSSFYLLSGEGAHVYLVSIGSCPPPPLEEFSSVLLEIL